MFCSNCGNKLADGSKFCNGCGAKIGDVINSQVDSSLDDDFEEDDDRFYVDGCCMVCGENPCVCDEDDEEDYEDDEDEDEDEDSSALENQYEAFLKTPLGENLKVLCQYFETSLDDILSNDGRDIFLKAFDAIINEDYENAFYFFDDYQVKGYNNLLSSFLFAKSMVNKGMNQLKEGNFPNSMLSAISILEKLKPYTDDVKYEIFNLKGKAYELQFEGLNLLKQVKQSKHTNQDEKYIIDAISNAINSYEEASNFTSDVSKKVFLLYKITVLSLKIDMNKALDTSLQCLSLLPNSYSEYGEPEQIIIDECLWVVIACYADLGDSKSCATYYSEYLKYHPSGRSDSLNVELNEAMQEIKEYLIKEGYENIFN